MDMKETDFKQRILYEMRSFLLYTAFLTLFFCSLTTYQRLLLDEYSIPYIHYGYSLVQAMIISKIIILGENLRLGKRWENKPLMIPTICKTVLFSLFVLIFSLLESFVVGFIRGREPAKVYQELMSHGIDAVLAKVWIVFFMFILFFAFIEISRVIGEGKLFQLFFYRKAD